LVGQVGLEPTIFTVSE